MLPRVAMVAAVVTFWSGAAFAAPDTGGVTLGNRVQLIAQRMSNGESYDRAARASPQVNERDQQIASEMAKGRTYREACLAASEPAEVVRARYDKHLAAMVDGGAHEAGWAASAR